mgnify:CR=1 FL=1
MNYILYNDYQAGSFAAIREEGFSSLENPIECFEAETFYEVFDYMRNISPKGKIPAIICYPLKEAIITFVTPDINVLQRIVGGSVEIVTTPDMPTVDIICNEEGKLNKMRLNRALTSNDRVYDVIAGPMVIMGVNESGQNVNPGIKTLEMLYYKFLEPEIFIVDRKQNTINSVKCSSTTAEIMRENNISIIG